MSVAGAACCWGAVAALPAAWPARPPKPSPPPPSLATHPPDVNLHNVPYKPGVIRGQLVPAAAGTMGPSAAPAAAPAAAAAKAALAPAAAAAKAYSTSGAAAQAGPLVAVAGLAALALLA